LLLTKCSDSYANKYTAFLNNFTNKKFIVMEPTTNSTTKATTPKQSTYLTIDQLIGKMTLTFDNAMLPEIFEPMLAVGYTAENIVGLKAQLANLIVLQQTQTKEYAEQYAEADRFDIKRKAIDAVFVKDRALAKVLFKGNVHAQTILKLTDATPKEYSAWAQIVNNFYTQISAPELLALATKIDITAAKAQAQKFAMTDLQLIKDNQSKETAEAQTATDARDRAFDALYPLYSEYIKYARILLADNQMLEAIGIKVKHE